MPPNRPKGRGGGGACPSYCLWGVAKGNLNTMSAFSDHQNFTGEQEDHSAQFRSINMRRWEFWDRLLRQKEIFDIKTEYSKPAER